eukprot:6276421-Prymnesium_polylepis.1
MFGPSLEVAVLFGRAVGTRRDHLPQCCLGVQWARGVTTCPGRAVGTRRGHLPHDVNQHVAVFEQIGQPLRAAGRLAVEELLDDKVESFRPEDLIVDQLDAALPLEGAH